jgi:hypothetical protein
MMHSSVLAFGSVESEVPQAANLAFCANECSFHQVMYPRNCRQEEAGRQAGRQVLMKQKMKTHAL